MASIYHDELTLGKTRMRYALAIRHLVFEDFGNLSGVLDQHAVGERYVEAGHVDRKRLNPLARTLFYPYLAGLNSYDRHYRKSSSDLRPGAARSSFTPTRDHSSSPAGGGGKAVLLGVLSVPIRSDPDHQQFEGYPTGWANGDDALFVHGDLVAQCNEF